LGPPWLILHHSKYSQVQFGKYSQVQFGASVVHHSKYSQVQFGASVAYSPPQ
jgi:hypothetical protein